MDYERIEEKKHRLNLLRDKINKNTMLSYESDFELNFTHNSTAIEGNTLTLIETKLLLEDNISVGGKELREIYEVVNHKKAYVYVKRRIAEKKPLDETAVKDIHEILTENIMQGGIYRNHEVRISGAAHTPPSGMEMYSQIKLFFEDLSIRQDLNPIELAAWTHAEFVRIHPFPDGNGRTARLIMNYQLMAQGFLPVDISKDSRLEYYNALEKYAAEADLSVFADFIAELEEKRLDMYLNTAEGNKI